MTPDPRWLEILKASGWQTAAVAIACGALLWANHDGWLPDAFNSWVGPLAVAMAICGSLALASLASKLEIQVENWHASFKEHRELRHSIETLNAGEATFLKSQVEKNQTTTQLHPFNAGGIPQFVQQTAMYQGLQNKRIVTVTAADPEGKTQTITIERAAWKLLKKKFEAASPAGGETKVSPPSPGRSYDAPEAEKGRRASMINARSGTERTSRLSRSRVAGVIGDRHSPARWSRLELFARGPWRP